MGIDWIVILIVGSIEGREKRRRFHGEGEKIEGEGQIKLKSK